jgi:hypothetical protein
MADQKTQDQNTQNQGPRERTGDDWQKQGGPGDQQGQESGRSTQQQPQQMPRGGDVNQNTGKREGQPIVDRDR